MKIQCEMSGHWNDDQLIAHLYGIGPEDGHLESCAQCRLRVSQLQARRASGGFEEYVSTDFLAAQRRRIYAKLTERQPWWLRLQVRRWASIAAAGLAISGGLLYVDEHMARVSSDKAPSDAQLAQDVSSMSENSEFRPTAPLQALFEE